MPELHKTGNVTASAVTVNTITPPLTLNIPGRGGPLRTPEGDFL